MIPLLASLQPIRWDVLVFIRLFRRAVHCAQNCCSDIPSLLRRKSLAKHGSQAKQHVYLFTLLHLWALFVSSMLKLLLVCFKCTYILLHTLYFQQHCRTSNPIKLSIQSVIFRLFISSFAPWSISQIIRCLIFVNSFSFAMRTKFTPKMRRATFGSWFFDAITRRIDVAQVPNSTWNRMYLDIMSVAALSMSSIICSQINTIRVVARLCSQNMLFWIVEMMFVICTSGAAVAKVHICKSNLQTESMQNWTNKWNSVPVKRISVKRNMTWNYEYTDIAQLRSQTEWMSSKNVFATKTTITTSSHEPCRRGRSETEMNDASKSHNSCWIRRSALDVSVIGIISS